MYFWLIDEKQGDIFPEKLGSLVEMDLWQAVLEAGREFSHLTEADRKKRTAFYIAIGDEEEPDIESCRFDFLELYQQGKGRD